MRTKHPDDYRWFLSEGIPFDWTGIKIEDESWIKGALGGLERSSFWTDRQHALRAALRHFEKMGKGFKPGDGRTGLFYVVGNQTWWEWAAEDKEFVIEVLEHVNNNFAVPEPHEEIVRQMLECHQRTISERRREQVTGAYGWRREQAVSTRESLQNHARRLRARRKVEDAEKGEALRAALAGETPHKEPEMWKGLMTKIAHEIAELYPSDNVDRLVGHFAPAFSVMKAGSPKYAVTAGEMSGWVSARLERERKRREENLARQDAKVRNQIEYVTGGERSTVYSKDEVETWKQSVGLRDNNWILVSKNVFYVFCNGTWGGSYTEKEFEAQGYKDLAAAAGVGLKTSVFNKEKGQETNIPLAKLLHEHGSKCTTRCDINCEKTWFDVDEHQLVLAGPARRPLTATFHAEVDQWFRVMTGRSTPSNEKVRQTEAAKVSSGVTDDYDVICDWLACVLQLDRPCAALYLQGVNSVGKGLFADGVARLWKTGPMGLEDAFDNFNSMLTETPFIWVDENDLPERVRASVLLRKALAAREFMYKRKYHDAGKIIGCLRMLFTANNLDLFNKAKEMLKKEDVDALALRFAHVQVRSEAITYLESTPRHGDFVEKNMIAEHALWLQEKRWNDIKARGLRFLVKGRHTVVSDIVATNADSTSECCVAICSALVNRERADWLTVKEDGELFVNASLLKKHLGFQPSAKAFSEVEITRAISSIASSAKTVRGANGRPMRMRNIRLQTLKAWCDYKEVYDWDSVKEAIAEWSKQPPTGSVGGGGGFGASSKIVN